MIIYSLNNYNHFTAISFRNSIVYDRDIQNMFTTLKDTSNENSDIL